MNGRDKNPKIPDMQHRHFAFIAEIVKESGLPSTERGHLAVVFAKRLKASNPRFSAQRFIEACGEEDYDASWI